MLAGIRSKLAKAVKPGISLKELDTLADELILESGGQASFKMVPGYNYATCLNLNQGIVHGIPNATIIKSGDLVSIDVGLYYQGYHTDAAITVIADKTTDQHDLRFLEIGKRALDLAINKAKAGNRVSDISEAMQRTVETAGYSCSRLLTGHGIGEKLHDDPPIPCIVDGRIRKDTRLYPGQTIAIEVIYSQGLPDMKQEEDGWTLITVDGKNSALFEETVLVSQKKGIILTK